MSNVDLTLDEIISKTRKPTGRVQKPWNPKKQVIKRRKEFGGGFSRRLEGYKDLDAVDDDRNSTKRGADNKIVRVNIFNLASTVTSSDLKELFEDHNLQSASVNFNEYGVSLGSADLFLAKSEAEKLIQKYTGSVFDGQEMKFLLVDPKSTTRRVKPVRTSTGGLSISQSRITTKAGRQDSRRRKEKARMTEAQLDAELDAYMAKNNS